MDLCGERRKTAGEGSYGAVEPRAHRSQKCKTPGGFSAGVLYLLAVPLLARDGGAADLQTIFVFEADFELCFARGFDARTGERGMMTWHDFFMQLLLIVAPAAILILIQIDRRR